MILPGTVAGWVGMILAVVTILSVTGTVIVKLAKNHISSNIDKKLGDRLEAAVLNGTAPMSARLDALHEQIVTQDGELARIGERTRAIETTLNNGLCTRQERIETKMDRLLEHLLWNGDERRNV